MQSIEPYSHARRDAAAQELVVFVDKIVSDATAQSDHQVVFARKKMNNCGGKGKPVGPHGLWFSDRNGEVEPGKVVEEMKLGFFFQQLVDGRRMVDDGRKDGFFGLVFFQQRFNGLHTIIFQDMVAEQLPVLKQCRFHAGIAKIQTECSHSLIDLCKGGVKLPKASFYLSP